MEFNSMLDARRIVLHIFINWTIYFRIYVITLFLYYMIEDYYFLSYHLLINLIWLISIELKLI